MKSSIFDRAVIVDGLNVAALSSEQIDRTRAGGVSAINHTILPIHQSFEHSMSELSRKLAFLKSHSETAMIVRKARDIQAAKSAGKLGVIMGCQSSSFVEHDLSLLEIVHDLGVRIMQPTHNKSNKLGAGALSVDQFDTGATPLGLEWLGEIERLGILADLSHCSLRSSDEFLSKASRPPVFSHANAFALWPSPRNKPDAMIRRIAELGGVIGAVMWTPTVCGDHWPTLDDYAAHIEHMVDVSGIEHVGFATDISDGKVEDPEQWSNAWGADSLPVLMKGIGPWYRYESERLLDYSSLSDTPKLWDRLVARGMSEDHVEKVMGLNFLRVFKEIWGG